MNYRVSDNGKAITCLGCGMTSHNENDVQNLYCGYCHVYLGKETHCDFCCAAGPLPGTYIASARIRGELPSGVDYIDDGEWGACEDCKALIDGKRWNDLVEVCVTGILAQHPERDYPGRRERLKHRTKLMIRAIFY